MDQNPQAPQSNTPEPKSPDQPASDTPKQPDPIPSQPAPAVEQPSTNSTPAPTPSTPPEVPISSTPAATASPLNDNASQTPKSSGPTHDNPVGSMPKASNKKTIAVAAAGISVILVVLGVYAMTKENFNTQTKQEAASKITTQKPTPSVPTLTPTPSDVVEQDLGAIENALKNIDQEASMADQGLSATPPDLQ